MQKELYWLKNSKLFFKQSIFLYKERDTIIFSLSNVHICFYPEYYMVEFMVALILMTETRKEKEFQILKIA